VRDRASFPAELQSAAVARRHAEAVLASWGLDDARDVVRLLVSELVVNAVLHAGSAPELVMEQTDGAVRVGVADSSTDPPVKQEYSPTSPSGRGLMILDDLADRWGVDHTECGKVVWFELSVGEPGA
jgi:anti-sigma regulatory factor (Ser/Thr protein kinase)